MKPFLNRERGRTLFASFFDCQTYVFYVRLSKDRRLHNEGLIFNPTVSFPCFRKNSQQAGIIKQGNGTILTHMLNKENNIQLKYKLYSFIY